MSRAPCIVAAFVAALLLSPSAVAVAQTVAGTVVEERTGQPVAGAIVSLLDASGGERGAVLTDAVGEYEIGAPGAGRYRLRIERIGYRTVYTGWFDTGRGERVVRRVSVPVEAIEIPAIEVAVEDRCVTRPDAAETLGIVWGEARKAMVATRLSRRGIPRRFEIVRIERRLDPRTGFVLEERVLDREALGESPFRTRPAEEIAEEGWASVERERVW
ncbi:MAG: carboxypeptidase-like regulatory domain-containing protein, partial [Gemmatimonadetes bacterium]|nr:carboxypeptidase-like regulatory domain-containing protein [Gemmatimonadota bacterium]